MSKRLKNKKKEMLIKVVVAVIGLLVFGAVVYDVNTDLPGDMRHMPRMDFETARILAVVEDNTVIDEEKEGIRRGTMLLEVELLTGPHAGEVGEIVNHFSPLIQIDVDVGDRISVRVGQVHEGLFDVLIHNRARNFILIASVVIFLGLLAAIGGKKGIKSIIGLIFTLVSISFLLIPLLIRGYSPIPVTIVILSVTTVFSLVLLSGWTKKTGVAIIGCMSGVIFAAMLAMIVGDLVGISGFNMEEAEPLISIAMDTELRVRGLFISGVLIASLGAVMDVAMTIATASQELVAANPKLTSKSLFKSGMNIGRDTMGTMSNTLILAFVGTGMNLLIMVFAYGIPFNQFINTDFIGVEIIRSLAGSLGIVLTVPIAAYVASKVMIQDTNVKKVTKKS